MHGLQTLKKLNAKKLDPISIATGEEITIHDRRNKVRIDTFVTSNDPKLAYFVAGGYHINKATGLTIGEIYPLIATPRGEEPESVEEQLQRSSTAHLNHDTEGQFAPAI